MRVLGEKVSVHYIGRLEDGTLIDDNTGNPPVQFIIGINAVLPGLDEPLRSMEVGEERTIHIPAAEAYGEYDPEGVIEYPREPFPNADDLQEGEMIEFFSDGTMAYPTVVSCKGDKVILDFNHPLAGKDLVYWIKVEG